MCETTDGSPLASDCESAFEDMSHPERVKGGKVAQCFETNPLGSGCKNVFWHGSCNITLCRKDDATDLDLYNVTIQTGARILHDMCKSGDRVGGYITYDSMGKANKGSPCSPKDGDSVDRSINIEFTKRKTN